MTKVCNNAEAKYGKEYYESAKAALKEKDKTVGDGDGKYTVKEFQNEFARLNNSVFANSDKLKSQAQGIIDSQSDLFNQYAGKDGVLNADEYCNLINSEEYGKAISQWRDMSAAMKEENSANTNNSAVINDTGADKFKDNGAKSAQKENEANNNNPIKNFFQSILNMFKEKTDEE